MRFGDHISQMDDKIGLSLKNSRHQLGVNLLAIPTISDEGKLKRRIDRFDLFDVLADILDRSCMGGKRDKKDTKGKEQAFPPIFLLEIISKIFHNGFV
jgi:hypothetical protein